MAERPVASCSVSRWAVAAVQGPVGTSFRSVWYPEDLEAEDTAATGRLCNDEAAIGQHSTLAAPPAS